MYKAIAIADSRYRKDRITTMEVVYPRFILPATLEVKSVRDGFTSLHTVVVNL